LEVLSNEALDAGVIRNTLLGTVGQYIPFCGAADWYIIDIWDCGVRDFRLKYKGNVIVEYQH
jgi:hypothetical protein